MILINHLIASLGIGIGGGLILYLFGTSTSNIILFAIMVLSANLMDLDHYSGNIKALFHAALATSDNDMDPWKPFISRKMPHNTQFYYGVLIGLSGLTLGYTLHMKMDGLI